MKIRLIIASAIFALIFGWVLVRHYLNIPQGKQKTKLEQLDKLIKTGIITLAEYDTTYQELKMGDSRLSVVLNYTYYADKKYTKEARLSDPPERLSFNVVYLPEDPNVCSKNPQEEYASAMRRLNEEMKPPILSWVFFVSSLCFLIYLGLSLRNEIKFEQDVRNIVNGK
jgi:hypothetical protein